MRRIVFSAVKAVPALPLAFAACSVALAQPTIVPDGRSATVVNQHDTGRLTVVPATADRDGISLNTYQRFDVGRPGADFDNTRANARLIVNEVTSALPSRLEGDIAIQGTRANFILANPNGILVNGTRFTNTGAVALATSPVSLVEYHPSPDRAQNNIRLQTSQGLLEIGPEGLAGAFTHLELIAKDIRINGPVENAFTHPESSVRLIGGSSVVEIDSGVSPVDEQTPWLRFIEGGDARQTVAVDITPLGSLQAGRIEVLVTDQGAGVRHAGTAYAMLNDFSLSSSGEVHLAGGSAKALGHVLIAAETLKASDNAEIDAQGGLLLLKSSAIDLTDSTAHGGLGVQIEANTLKLTTTAPPAGSSTAAPAVVTSLSSRGGGVELNIRDTVTLTGADITALTDVTGKIGQNLTLDHNDAGAARIIAATGRLKLDVAGTLVNNGGLLQGHAADPAHPEEGAVLIGTGGELINRSTASDRLAVIFGEAGDIVLHSTGDITNNAGRIIANGHLKLSTDGDVHNRIDKTPGAYDELTQTDTDRQRFLGLTVFSDHKVETDYGALIIPDQLAYLVADGNLDITARNIRSIGGQIHANNGDMHLTASEQIENRVVRTGQTEYRKVCRIFCRPQAKSTVVLHGGGIQATGSITLSAGKGVINQGGSVDAVDNIDLRTPLVRAEAMDAYLAMSQAHGFQSWFGKGYGRLFRQDTGGAFNAGGSLTASGDLITDGGVLHIGGATTIDGTHTHLRDPVREPAPTDLPKGGLFSFLFD